MNILCICEGGNSRSVGCAQLMKVEFGYNAIAVGSMFAFNSERGRQPGMMLCQWADLIVFMSDYIVRGTPIPANCKHKVRLCEVGQDTYHRSGMPDQRLWDLCRVFIAGGMTARPTSEIVTI